MYATNAKGDGQPLDSFDLVCPRSGKPVPSKPSTPKVVKADKKFVELEWRNYSPEDDIRWV